MMANTKQQVTSKQADQKQHHDNHSRLQPMFPDTTVLSENRTTQVDTCCDSTETGSSDF